MNHFGQFISTQKSTGLFIAALIFASIVLFFSWHALYFGLGPHDEGFYISLPYRFTLGDRFFVDEYNITQTSTFYLFPFIKAYISIVHSTDGIVLFARYLYFTSSVLLAGFTFFVFRKFIESWAALSLAMLCLVFVPFHIPALSYNTLANFFLMTGYLFGVWAALGQQNGGSLSFKTDEKNKSSLLLFFSGAMHVQAIICYPTLIILPVIYAVCLTGFFSKKQIVCCYGLGGILGGLWFLIVILHTGLPQLLVDYHYVKSFGLQAGGFFKIITLLKAYSAIFPKHYILLSLIFIGIILVANNTNLAVCFMLAFLMVFSLHTAEGIFLLINISLIVPLLALLALNKNAVLVKQLFFLMALPAFIAGLVTSWSSSNGTYNNCIGSFPSALVAIFYMMLIGRQSVKQSKNGIVQIQLMPLVMLIPVLFIYTLLNCNVHYTYEDVTPNKVTTNITSGPFQGMYATNAAENYYVQLKMDMDNIYQPNKRILFFDDFPAGYLFTKMQPATNSTWLFSSAICPTIDRVATLAYYKKNRISPDFIVKIKKLPANFTANGSKQRANDPIVALTKTYKVLIDRNGYTIYQRLLPNG